MRASPSDRQPEKQNIDENSLVMSYGLQQQNLGTCTKYNHCINPTSQFPPQNFHQSPDQSFQFPSDILTSQQPAEISVQPIIQQQNDGHLVDQIMRSNLVGRKREKIREREEEEKKVKEIERNLGRVRDNARKELERARRRSEEKRPEWGHSIFGDKEKQMKDKFKSKSKVKSNQKSKQKQKSKSKSRSKNKVQLKDIKTRIKQYKQNQLKKLQHHKTSRTCLHSHQNPQKTPSQIKAQIDKRAQQITKKMKEQKAKIKEDRKLIKAKIRAIQIQSRASLKKFGKRPVDSTIQFVVQMPAVQAKEKKKGNKRQRKESQISSIKGRDDGLASSEFQSRTGSSKMPTNRSKSRRQLKQIDKNTKKSTKSVQQLQTNRNAQENQQLMDSKGKFYFWDMPIYENDCKVINLGLKNSQNLMEQQKKNEKSFRDEVQEYLMQKQRSKMHNENKAAKQHKLQQLINKKKQQFLSQYQNSNTQSLNNTDQLFWNEDQLFKLQPISNFK